MANSTENLFKELCHSQFLHQAWLKVKANKGCAGADGVDMARFGQGVGIRLDRLSRDLVAGTYVPGPLRVVDVKKKAGGIRRLNIPTIADRVVQTAVAIMIGPVLEQEFEDNSYAYRPGRSVQQAVRRIGVHYRNGYRWVVEGDIDDYFDNIDHKMLLERLSRYVKDIRILDLIELWLDCFSADGRGIAQGSPVSPLLSNLYLDEIDENMERKGVRLVRFADDFVLLCKEKVRAEKAMIEVGRELESLGLRMDVAKCRIVSFDQGFRFLGHLFVRSLILQDVWEDGGEASWENISQDLPQNNPEGQASQEAFSSRSQAKSPLKPLYVYDQGRRVCVKGSAVILTDDQESDGQEIVAIPSHHVGRVEVGRGVTIDQKDLTLLAGMGIPVVMVSGRGEVLAHMDGVGSSSRHGLQVKQARCALDMMQGLELARHFVDGRLRNQRALLKRLDRRRKDPRMNDIIKMITREIRRLKIADDVESLRGMEGSATRAYWRGFSLMLGQGFALQGRKRNPPDGPVNILLNFTAGLLYRDMSALIRQRGLHPGFSVLHAAGGDYDTLSSDLMEEFRSPLAEGLVAYLINNRMITRDHFSRDQGNSWYMHKEARSMLVREYESWLARLIKSNRQDKKITWRQLMAEQVRAYENHILGHEEYYPYVMDY